MDGNNPCVDADLFYMDKKRCVFKNLQIHVDGAYFSNFDKHGKKLCCSSVGHCRMPSGIMEQVLSIVCIWASI